MDDQLPCIHRWIQSKLDDLALDFQGICSDDPHEFIRITGAIDGSYQTPILIRRFLTLEGVHAYHYACQKYLNVLPTFCIICNSSPALR